MENVILHFVHPSRNHNPAHLRLLPERDYIGFYPEVFKSPHPPRRSEPCLNLIENEHDIFFPAHPFERLEEFLSKMIIPAFPLNRLDYQARNIVPVFSERFIYLFESDSFLLFHFFQDILGYGETKFGVQNSRPFELREIFDLRVRCVRQRERISAPPVKCLPEVDDFRSPLLAFTRSEIFPDLPVHRCLQGVFHRERPARYEKEMAHESRFRESGKDLHETRVFFRINIRIRGVLERGRFQFAEEIPVHHLRVIVPDGESRKIRIHVQIFLSRSRVHHVRSFRPFEVNNYVKAVNQNISRKRIYDLPGANILSEKPALYSGHV